MPRTTSRFLDDPAYVRKYDVRLALVLGDKAATMLQQIHYHTVWKEAIHGTREWRSTLKEWHATFPYWSEMTIRRVLEICRDAGVLLTRKETTGSRTHIWFSIDYDVLEALGQKGEQKYQRACAKKNSETDEEGADVQIEQSEADVQIEQPPVFKMNTAGVQNEQLLVNHSTTSSTTPTRPRSARRRVSSDFAEKQKAKSAEAHAEVLRKRFNKAHSAASFEKNWESLATLQYGPTGYVPFSPADRKLAHTQFFPWCEKAKIHPFDFSNWIITNWDRLKTGDMAWANLPDAPTFSIVYRLKDRFISSYRKMGKTVKTTPRTVITNVSQIPKGHPQFKQLKVLIQTVGRAEL